MYTIWLPQLMRIFDFFSWCVFSAANNRGGMTHAMTTAEKSKYIMCLESNKLWLWWRIFMMNLSNTEYRHLHQHKIRRSRYTYIVSRTVNYYTYTSRVGNICLHFESQLFVYTSVLTSSWMPSSGDSRLLRTIPPPPFEEGCWIPFLVLLILA